MFWREDTHEQVGYIPPGSTDPVVVGPDKAATLAPDGSIVAYDISNPPPEFAGADPLRTPRRGGTGAPGAPSAAGGEPPRPHRAGGDPEPRRGLQLRPLPPRQGRLPRRQRLPRPAHAGPAHGHPLRVDRGPLHLEPGRDGPGRGLGDDRRRHRRAVHYGWGVPGFGKDPIKINEDYLDNLGDPKQAPGYIPGSGTYNQFLLNKEGLFGTLPGQQGEVNLRHGLGGTGDPTTGREVQTPWRWVTGNASDPITAEPNDDAWRRRTGQGGGGYDPAQAVAIVPPYQYGGRRVRPGLGSGGGTGGGFFGAGPGYSPAERGQLWGKDAMTAGLDYLVTNFMRSDTPTGISTVRLERPPAVLGRPGRRHPGGQDRGHRPPGLGHAQVEEPHVHPLQHRRGGPDREPAGPAPPGPAGRGRPRTPSPTATPRPRPTGRRTGPTSRP